MFRMSTSFRRIWCSTQIESDCIPAFGPGRTDNPCDMYHFWSLHSGGANFAFADDSVQFLPYSVRGILPALATRAGGETASLPD